MTMNEFIGHVCQASRTPSLLSLHLIAVAICRLTGVQSVAATAGKHCSFTTRYDGKVLVLAPRTAMTD